MADSHSNRDVPGRIEFGPQGHSRPASASEVIERLTKKAGEMTVEGSNTITAGAPGEKSLTEEQVGVFLVRRLPDDPDCLRISIGEPNALVPGAYVVIRGQLESAIELLERALCALKVSKMESGA